jgi:hypothetical protein
MGKPKAERAGANESTHFDVGPMASSIVRLNHFLWITNYHHSRFADKSRTNLLQSERGRLRRDRGLCLSFQLFGRTAERPLENVPVNKPAIILFVADTRGQSLEEFWNFPYKESPPALAGCCVQGKLTPP